MVRHPGHYSIYPLTLALSGWNTRSYMHDQVSVVGETIIIRNILSGPGDELIVACSGLSEGKELRH